MNSRAGLLVQSGFLPNPVEDLPVQSTVVIQEGLQVRKACEQDIAVNLSDLSNDSLSLMTCIFHEQ